MAFFQPILRIQPSADLKSYTLEATVLVPSGCYVANGVVPGLPPEVLATPETEPVCPFKVRVSWPLVASHTFTV